MQSFNEQSEGSAAWGIHGHSLPQQLIVRMKGRMRDGDKCLINLHTAHIHFYVGLWVDGLAEKPGSVEAQRGFGFLSQYIKWVSIS